MRGADPLLLTGRRRLAACRTAIMVLTATTEMHSSLAARGLPGRNPNQPLPQAQLPAAEEEWTMKLMLLPEGMAVCRLEPGQPWPGWVATVLCGDEVRRREDAPLAGGSRPERKRKPLSLFSLTMTQNELSVVCPEKVLPADVTGTVGSTSSIGPAFVTSASAGIRVEMGWRCLGVEGPLPFTMVGVLAALARTLADAQVPIMAISTFDTDYLLVKEDQLERAVEALRAAGHQIAEPGLDQDASSL